jgi:hypothetical protein
VNADESTTLVIGTSGCCDARLLPHQHPHLPLRGTGAALARDPAQRRIMTNFSKLPAMPSGAVVSPVAALRLAVAAYLARFKDSSRDHTGSDLRAISAGAPTATWTRWPHGDRTWSCTSGGCRSRAGSGRQQCPGGSLSRRVLPGLRHRQRPWALAGRVRPPPLCAGRVTHARIHAPAVRSPAHRSPTVQQRHD